MPHLGRPLADVEDRGDFRKTQLFEIVHHQDLAIDRRQLLQGRVHVPALFLAEQGMAGRRVIRHQAIDHELGRAVGPGEGVCLFSRNASGLRPPMPAVRRRQPLGGEAVQPGVKRQRAIARIVRQLSRRRRPDASCTTSEASTRAANRSSSRKAIMRRNRSRWRSRSLSIATVSPAAAFLSKRSVSSGPPGGNAKAISESTRMYPVVVNVTVTAILA